LTDYNIKINRVETYLFRGHDRRRVLPGRTRYTRDKDFSPF